MDDMLFIEVHTVHDRRPMWLRVDEIESILDEAEYVTTFPQEVPGEGFYNKDSVWQVAVKDVTLTTKATRVAMKSGDAGFVIETGDRIMTLIERAISANKDIRTQE